MGEFAPVESKIWTGRPSQRLADLASEVPVGGKAGGEAGREAAEGRKGRRSGRVCPRAPPGGSRPGVGRQVLERCPKLAGCDKITRKYAKLVLRSLRPRPDFRPCARGRTAHAIRCDAAGVALIYVAMYMMLDVVPLRHMGSYFVATRTITYGEQDQECSVTR